MDVPIAIFLQANGLLDEFERSAEAWNRSMTYFSRLTDIVTCNLSNLLAEAPDPRQAIAEVIAEMHEGVAGARRSVDNADRNVTRLSGELNGLRQEAVRWGDMAKKSLMDNDDRAARQAIVRRRESEALISGMEQQLKSAEATRSHLTTMQRALEARLAEAQRRQTQMDESSTPAEVDADHWNNDDIDAELAAMKREIGQG